MTRRSSNVKDERGAVAVFVAVSLTLLMIAAAFAVDLGMQRVLKRDMQALADVVALDMTRALDGRTHAVIKATSDWRGQLRQSVARNTGIAADEITAQQQQEKAIAEVPGTDLIVTATMGVIRNNVFEAVPYPVVPSAVQVTARSSVDFAFAQIVGISEGGAGASAVGTDSDPTVCFSVGTRTLALDTASGTLSPLLSGVLGVNLSAVGYSGIADLTGLSLPLVGLLAELNVGSVNALATSQVTLANLIVAMAEVAEANNKTFAAQILRDIELGVPGQNIALSRILNVGTATDVAGLVADVNVLDLLSAGIFAANGQNGIGVNIPGVASVTVTEPPQIACGGVGTEARSAQIKIEVDLDVLADPPLRLLGGDITLPVQVGRALATLQSLGCEPDAATLRVTTSAVSVLPAAGDAHVRLRSAPTVVSDLLGPVTRVLFDALGPSEVRFDVSVTGGIGASTETPTVTYPASGLPAPIVVPAGGLTKTLELQPAGPPQLSLGQNDVERVLGSLLTTVLGGVLTSFVAPVVNGPVNTLLTATLSPLFDALGIKLGLAEVSMLSSPACAAVRLAD